MCYICGINSLRIKNRLNLKKCLFSLNRCAFSPKKSHFKLKPAWFEKTRNLVREIFNFQSVCWAYQASEKQNKTFCVKYTSSPSFLKISFRDNCWYVPLMLHFFSTICYCFNVGWNSTRLLSYYLNLIYRVFSESAHFPMNSDQN